MFLPREEFVVDVAVWDYDYDSSWDFIVKMEQAVRKVNYHCKMAPLTIERRGYSSV